MVSWNNRINEKLDYLLNEELNEELIDLLIRKKTKTTYFKNINIENYDIILLKVEKNAQSINAKVPNASNGRIKLF